MATNTYVELKKTTLATNTATVEITSIPQGYTDLVLVINAGNASGSGSAIRSRINNDSGSNYSVTYLDGNGSNVVSARDTNNTTIPTGWRVSAGSSIDANIILHYMNYSNTTTFKTVLMRTNNANQGTDANVALWRNTSAITSLSFVIGGFGASTGDFLAGSTFSLYGIRASGVSPTPKATGGAIYSDDTYYYHVFGSTGTFTPLQSLTADVLVVAGGGGGGTYRGGGGGAGGLLTYSSQSLSATGYTCTVGAGGGTSASGTNSQFGGLTASVGGGAGGSGNGPGTGVTGGSGGGGAGFNGNKAGGSGTSGQGNAGGIGSDTNPYPAGGGGGAGAVGVDGSGSVAGNGGIGATSSLLNAIGVATGTGQLSSGNYYFAGGGGGGLYGVATQSSGGLGGGAAGAQGNGVPANATAGTGGGGGGGGFNGSTQNGGNGGSGIVIVRYAK